MLKLYDQETFSGEGTHGDCTRAAIRTLLQLDMPDCPHPIAEGNKWNDAFWEYVEDLGYFLHLDAPVTVREACPRICLAGGPTVRTADTGATHMVVWDRVEDRCIHDPHPSRAGLLSAEIFYWLEPADAH